MGVFFPIFVLSIFVLSIFVLSNSFLSLDQSKEAFSGMINNSCMRLCLARMQGRGGKKATLLQDLLNNQTDVIPDALLPGNSKLLKPFTNIDVAQWISLDGKFAIKRPNELKTILNVAQLKDTLKSLGAEPIGTLPANMMKGESKWGIQGFTPTADTTGEGQFCAVLQVSKKEKAARQAAAEAKRAAQPFSKECTGCGRVFKGKSKKSVDNASQERCNCP